MIKPAISYSYQRDKRGKVRMDPCAEVLVFEIEGQRHALPVAQVRELLPALSTTPIPGAPPGVEGVINLRGVVVPVLDVRHHFGLESKLITPADHFIVASIREQLVVLHVDRALELVRFDAAALTQGDETHARVAKSADGLVILHQAEHFLSAAQAAMLRSMREGRS